MSLQQKITDALKSAMLAKQTARFWVMVVFPTPPFRFVMAIFIDGLV